GKVLLGAVGYENRMSISVTSDSVNLASRIDGLNKKFGVDTVCSKEFVSKIGETEKVRFIALIRVDGREAATEIYEVMGHLSAEEQERRKNVEGYIREAVLLSQRGDYSNAFGLIGDALKLNPAD